MEMEKETYCILKLKNALRVYITSFLLFEKLKKEGNKSVMLLCTYECEHVNVCLIFPSSHEGSEMRPKM